MSERPSWDAYFMGFAFAAAARATCDRKHVGAVIVVGAEKRPGVIASLGTGECARTYKTVWIGGHVAATGYNGSVAGMPHCSGEGGVGHDMVDSHCARTVHAELNALAQAAKRGVAVDGGTIYTTASPCWDCFRVLVNAGLKRFVYAEDYRGEEHRERILVVAKATGVVVEKLG